MSPLSIAVVVTAVLVAAQLAFDRADAARAFGGSAKLLCAGTFVVAGAMLSRLPGDAHLAFVVALVLCAVGDALLIPRGNKRAFLGGLGSFLLGHVGYGVCFVLLGVDVRSAVVAALVLAAPVVFVLRWLLPSVPAGLMKRAVIAYVVVICAMVALSVGAVAHGAPLMLAAGAVTFWASDLCVARERFVSPGALNRVVGLPLYFGAQLLFVAGAAAWAPAALMPLQTP